MIVKRPLCEVVDAVQHVLKHCDALVAFTYSAIKTKVRKKTKGMPLAALLCSTFVKYLFMVFYEPVLNFHMDRYC
jgi:hypothetical protein